MRHIVERPTKMYVKTRLHTNIYFISGLAYTVVLLAPYPDYYKKRKVKFGFYLTLFPPFVVLISPSSRLMMMLMASTLFKM